MGTIVFYHSCENTLAAPLPCHLVSVITITTHVVQQPVCACYLVWVLHIFRKDISTYILEDRNNKYHIVNLRVCVCFYVYSI
jgi:hypothetical protein